MSEAADYDVVIVGGGLVGASLACALRDQPLRVAVVEAYPLTADAQPSFDDRAVALAQGSQRIFRAMNAWDADAMEATAIHRIHVSDRGRFGFVHLDRDDEGVDALGWVAPARALGQHLGSRLRDSNRIDFICPARVDELRTDNTSAMVRLNDGRAIRARLLVAADGAKSVIRERLNIPVREWNYDQTAIITNVRTQLPHGNVAYERFTESGPLALLPMGDRRCAVVFTVRAEEAEYFSDCDDAGLLAEIQNRFGQRLGRIETIGRRVSYPLGLVRSEASTAQRVALIGNAVHTLHPIAGQGFNLGLRDVAVLAEETVDAVRRGADPGAESLLDSYAARRTRDHRHVTALTDGLTRVFANPLSPVRAGRDLVMTLMDFCPPARRAFAHLMMGRSGKLSRLARGMPL